LNLFSPYDAPIHLGAFYFYSAIFERKMSMIKKSLQSKAQVLLLEYRAATWRKSALESISKSGSKTLQSSIEQIRFTNELVETLRCNKLLGEKLYRIIYASYMTEKQPSSVEEILAAIAKMHEYIPRRTYFRLKKRALEMLDVQLKEIAMKIAT